MYELLIVGALILAALFYAILRLRSSVRSGGCACSSGGCPPKLELGDLRGKDSGGKGCGGGCVSCGCAKTETH